jgi:chloramphenicol 3-O-phosphotransferase
MHMLPPSHLDLVTVFGASTGARAEMSQLLAVQTAAVLYHHQPDNQRTLLMGVTLPGTDAYWDDDEHTFERAGFFVDILAFIATLS